MTLPTTKKITEKQFHILKSLAKLRMGSIYHITYILYPDLRDKRKEHSKFETKRKSVAKILKRLQDAKLIRIARPVKSFDVFYYLSPEGQQAVYTHLKISELHKGRKSGFDFDLGYFDWRIPPYENVHFQFQTDVTAAVMSLNREVEIASIEEQSDAWEFGGVRMTNICSIRDNLHSSPRNTKIKENEVYKPDGELFFRQSRYNEQGQLILETNNSIKEILVEQEFYFLEYDRKTEYGERLEAKFIRLNKRLMELESRNELKYFKGMIVVLDDKQNILEEQVRARHYRFYSTFMAKCGKYADRFNIITTTYSKLSQCLLSLRREYTQDFGKALIQSWKHPLLANTFIYGEINERSKSFTNVQAPIGNIRARYNAKGSHLCLFMEVEGLTSIEWLSMYKIYNAFRERAQQHNQKVADKVIAGHPYKVVPIVTYRLQPPYAPQWLTGRAVAKEQESFFKNLYLLDIRTTRPVFYKEGTVISTEEIDFIV